jgi:hypothetical protein
MQARYLQTVLLIQAVEETDRSQQVLPGPDRVGATKKALGNGSPPPQPGPPLQPSAEGFLTRRAEVLLGKLRSRAPAVGRILAISDSSSPIGLMLLPLAVIAGALLSFLSGRRISLFSWPLLLLLAWNLGVYGLALARVLSNPGPRWLRQFWFGKLYSRWLRRETDALLTDSIRFNAPLAPGLRRFTSEWWESARPLLELRARWLLHLSAALIALGFVTGLYIHAILLHDPAGWSASSLTAGTARGFLIALYGPASVVTGIPIPPVDALELVRWDGSAGGGDSHAWAHLMAVTVALCIIVPRLLAALASALERWRLSRELAPPPSLITYAKVLLERARSA